MTNSSESPYSRHVTEDRRLVILRVLSDSANYQTNEYTLEAVLDELGHTISNDRLRADLAWLTEQGLGITTNVGGVTIAKLTQRGLDVARGKAVVPGVKRPQPE